MLLALTGMVVSYRGHDWRIKSETIHRQRLPGGTTPPVLLDVSMEMVNRECDDYRDVRNALGGDHWCLDVLGEPKMEMMLVQQILNEN